MSDITGTMGEQVLRALGLDAVCVQVYLLMHSDPDADSAGIAGQLGLNPSDVSDAINTLTRLTLLRPGLEHTGRLRPVSIERALSTLLRQHSEQLALQSDSLATLQSAMKDLLEAPQTPHEDTAEIDIEAISGGEAIQSRLDGLAVRARESFHVILPGGPQPPEMLEAARPFDQELIRRGVRVRLVYQTLVRTDRNNVEYMRWLEEMGAETRCAPVVPPRMILIDGNTALLSLGKNRDVPGAFLIREPGIVAPLAELFEQCWAAAEPLSRAEPTDDGTPSAQELALLRILAAGSTDEAAAKKLGVSVRTVRRIMADLMERLGATSRFEAGHRATQRDWL